MENASKALIIAGAILLSILIIALGIYVFNIARGATNTNSLDEIEVSQFNQPFTQYRGKQLGSGVIDLLDKLVANATVNAGAADRLPDIVYILKAGTSANANTLKSTSTNANIGAIGALRREIAERHYYYVDFVNDDTTGLIKAVAIYYQNDQKNKVLNGANKVNLE